MWKAVVLVAVVSVGAGARRGRAGGHRRAEGRQPPRGHARRGRRARPARSACAPASSSRCARAEVHAIRRGRERAMAGDANDTRLLFSPTGRPLRKGEGYFSDFELLFPGVAVGLTDHLSIAGRHVRSSPASGSDEQAFYVVAQARVAAFGSGGGSGRRAVRRRSPTTTRWTTSVSPSESRTFGRPDKSLSLGVGVAAADLADGFDRDGDRHDRGAGHGIAADRAGQRELAGPARRLRARRTSRSASPCASSAAGSRPTSGLSSFPTALDDGGDPALGLGLLPLRGEGGIAASARAGGRRRARAGDVAARPRPLEVEAADAAVHVADLAAEVEAGAAARLHGRRGAARRAARRPPSTSA